MSSLSSAPVHARLNKYMQLVQSPFRSSPILTVGFATTAVLLLSWTIHDYIAWIRFGTGGLPSNPFGYLQLSFVRLLRLTFFRDDLTDVSTYRTSGPSYLSTPLPLRAGPRPANVARPVPQRQKPMPIPPQVRQRVHSLVHKLHDEHPELLELRLSRTEGGTTDAIYARKDLASLNPVARHRALDHEIAHCHPQESSLHVWLSEADAREVVLKGWGQRFPLPKRMIAGGWTHVYAPRTEAECEVVEKVMRAGVGWICGVEV